MGTLLENCKAKFKACPIGKIETDSIAYFFKRRDPNRCNIFGFRHSTAQGADILYSYQYADKPDERICGLNKCDMTGTLFVTPNVTPPAPAVNVLPTVTTEIKANGEDFQFGYMRLFIFGEDGDEFKISVSNMGGTGTNEYSVKMYGNGWNSFSLELFNPAEITDGGWVADGGSIKLVVSPQQETLFRLSTVELFDDIFGLVHDQTIGFQCISDFSGDPALTLTEDICDIPSYDETATTIERSLTATNIIGELAEFHNITRRQKASEHLVQTTGSFTAKSETVDGIEFAVFVIPEMADIKCPRLLVQPQNCEFDSLYHADIGKDTHVLELPEEHFFHKDNKVYMSKTYVGTKIVVAYPIWIEGTGWDITAEDLNKQHYEMELVTPICGDEYIVKADNVMLTALPLTWTNAAGSFTVGYSMAKDSYGKYGQIIKIDQRK